MPYCDNCGNKYAAPKNYCRRCGTSLAAFTTGGLATVDLSEHVATGIELAHSCIVRRRNIASGSNEALQLFVGFVAAIALIHGMAYMAGPATLNLLNGELGYLLIGGAILGAFCKVVFDLRAGYSLARSLLEVTLVGALTYLMCFSAFWYFTDNYLHSGKPLLDLSNMVPKATPTALPGR